MMFALFSMLAFAIDVGYLAQSRAEATRAADSAALAGCWELYQQLENNINADLASMESPVLMTAANYALLNHVCQSGPELNPTDVQVGFASQLRGGEISNNSDWPYYAVRVKLHKNEDLNGQVPHFFGRIFGNTGKSLSVESTAIMARGVSGFNLPLNSSRNLNILPFALDAETWNDLLADMESGFGGVDNYSYNPTTGAVTPGSDGIFEVNLFPQGTGSPGNRGTVDIGGSNNSTNDVKRQILYGISNEDLVKLGKPLAINPETGTLLLNGNTGISAGVKEQLSQIIGQKRIIPIFTKVQGNGNNAMYTIVRFVGVRIMNVKLTGSMNSKQLIVQPAPVIAEHGIHCSEISGSDFVLTPVILAQ